MAFETEYESEAMEGWESESEAWEARPRVKKPSTAPSFKPRPPANAPAYVTQTQLQAALVRVDGKIKTAGDSIGAVNGRVSAMKKELDERKKTGENQNKEMNQKLQMLALLPILVKPPVVTLQAGSTLTAADGSTVSQISVPDTNNLDAILPLMLVSGMGSGSGGMGLGEGSDNMMMLALVLLFANRP